MASQQVLNALETLHRELEKLEPAIKHVETAQQVTQMVKDIPQKHLDLLKEVKENDVKHKEELKDIFTKEISEITIENKKLARTTGEIQEQVKKEQEALAKLKDTVQSFHERVEKINFPERLDKLDANVAGIMAAIQSVQSRLDNIERNLSDRIKDLAEYQKESRIMVLLSLESISKRQFAIALVTCGLIVIGVIVIIFIWK